MLFPNGIDAAERAVLESRPSPIRCESATDPQEFSRSEQLLHSSPTDSLMTDYREINDIAKDARRVRSIAEYLLKLCDMDWTDWELDFLDTMRAREEPLSTRQAEKVVELRDDAVLYRKVDGFVLKTLIGQCYLYRNELNSDYERQFVERLKSSGQEALRKRDALRLLQCARAIGEIEQHHGWTFVAPAIAS